MNTNDTVVNPVTSDSTGTSGAAGTSGSERAGAKQSGSAYWCRQFDNRGEPDEQRDAARTGREKQLGPDARGDSWHFAAVIGGARYDELSQFRRAPRQVQPKRILDGLLDLFVVARFFDELIDSAHVDCLARDE